MHKIQMNSDTHVMCKVKYKYRHVFKLVKIMFLPYIKLKHLYGSNN